MNILKNLFLFHKKNKIKDDLNQRVCDHFVEIAKLVKEARIQQYLSIEELSLLSKITQ